MFLLYVFMYVFKQGAVVPMLFTDCHWMLWPQLRQELKSVLVIRLVWDENDDDDDGDDKEDDEDDPRDGGSDFMVEMKSFSLLLLASDDLYV